MIDWVKSQHISERASHYISDRAHESLMNFIEFYIGVFILLFYPLSFSHRLSLCVFATLHLSPCIFHSDSNALLPTLPLHLCLPFFELFSSSDLGTASSLSFHLQID